MKKPLEDYYPVAFVIVVAAIALIALLLTGCANMPEAQRAEIRQKVWIALGTAAAGYVLADDEGDTFNTTIINEEPGSCEPRGQCRD